MCTVSHCLSPHRLLVTMNRDESLERGPESPPRLHGGAIPWLAPGDGEGGGTWVGVNSFGIVACLLNGYPAGDLGPAVSAGPSRGGIIPQLMARGDADSVLAWLSGRFDPNLYQPFKLLVYSTTRGEALVWDGEGPIRGDTAFSSGWGIVTSSSWRQDEVVGWRCRKFAEWVKDPRFNGQLPTFNLLHEAGKEWWSPLVSRQRSVTRSITQVEVAGGPDGGWIEMRYWPRPFEERTRPDYRLRMPLSGFGTSRSGGRQSGALPVP